MLIQVPINLKPWRFHDNFFEYAVSNWPKLLLKKTLPTSFFFYSRIVSFIKEIIGSISKFVCNLRLPRVSISLLLISSLFWYICSNFGALYNFNYVVWNSMILEVLLGRLRAILRQAKRWFSTVSQRVCLLTGLLFEMSFLWCQLYTVAKIQTLSLFIVFQI